MHKNKLLPIILFVFLISSCDDFLEYKNKDKVIPNNLEAYNDLIYGDIIQKNEIVMEYLPYMTDEVDNIAKFSEYDDVEDKRNDLFAYFTWAENNQLTYENQEKQDNAWGYFYYKILMCNIVEKEISKFEESEDKNRMQGEIYFMRALAYYYLVNLYGEVYENEEQAKKALGVPINTSSYIEKKIYTRSSLADVYSVIEKNLINAINQFSKINTNNTIFRPGLDCSRLVLSRVYLYQKKWEKAKKICDDLLLDSNNRIESIKDIEDLKSSSKVLFDKNNPAILFCWGKKTIGSFNSSLYFSKGKYIVDKKLNNSYVQNDVREGFYIKKTAGATYPNKYKTHKKSTYDFTLRLTEVYFNRAEACINLGENYLPQALDDIKYVLNNRIPTKSTITFDNVEMAKNKLAEEKYKEFCFEDVRWFDIRRWNMPVEHYYYHVETPEEYDVYRLKPKSPNYALNIPLDVARINTKITHIQRENTKVNK